MFSLKKSFSKDNFLTESVNNTFFLCTHNARDMPRVSITRFEIHAADIRHSLHRMQLGFLGNPKYGINKWLRSLLQRISSYEPSQLGWPNY